MKKIALLLLFVCVRFAADAQVTPYVLGSSPYIQNFDDLSVADSLPGGWMVYQGSASDTIGWGADYDLLSSHGLFNDTLPADGCLATYVVGHGFKNFASADVITEGATCTDQINCTNRALGVRQIGYNSAHAYSIGWDSGAAFVFNIANTEGYKNFKLTFNLQSLDTSSPRIVTWLVDYAVGTPSTFIPLTTEVSSGVWTTGGNSFANNHDSVDFGSALDNSSQPVWIRVVTLVYSSGAGARPSTAIDDYKLTYESTSGVNNVTAPVDMSLTVIGRATTNSLTLGYSAPQEGAYHLTICDMMGRVVRSEDINARMGAQNFTINDLNVAPGMYIAKVSNGKTTGVTKVVVQ